MRCLASTKVTIPSRCLQTTKRKRGHTQHPQPLNLLETSILAQIGPNSGNDFCIGCPGQKARQGTASAAHNRPQRRSEPFAKQKGQGAKHLFQTHYLYYYIKIYIILSLLNTSLNNHPYHQYPYNIYLCGFLCNLSGSSPQCCKYPTTGAGSANPVVSMIT